MSVVDDRAVRAARARDRAEVWATTFRALYGPPRGEGVGLDPGELPTLDPGGRATRRQLVARPGALRGVLAPVIAAGRDEAYARDMDFRELVIAAVRDLPLAPGSYGEARARLLEATPAAANQGVELDQAVRAVERLLAPEELLVVEPGVIVQRDGVSTVTKRARFHAPFMRVRPLLDPREWLEMGPFFDHVEAVPGEHCERTDGWYGLFEEKFVIAWAEMPMQTFHTFLKIDFTYDSGRARADYSLVYEEDDQLERDDGFIEVRRIPGRPDWCTYYAEKAMRMRSPQSNMFAPMIMSVFLESGLWALEDMALDHQTKERAASEAVSP